MPSETDRGDDTTAARAGARHRRARNLLSAAIDLEPEDRRSYLVRAAGDDEALRAELLSLLDAHERTGRLDRMADSLRAEGGRAGARAGHYRLLERIGGGMGAVYLAERDDGQFEQRVVLKLLPLGMNTEAARRRFVTERAILARLEHPGIASLLDGGVTEDGTPYLVLEYVPGQPLDAYCREQDLSVDERLDLFLEVCDAVEYAHRSLVVHRDLKPANILVTEGGRVKLLDFGIAKVLDEGGDPGTVTRLAGGPMTPAFASPEQVRGDAITTATDIYTLGVLLYRLLADQAPYEVRSRSRADLEAVICEADPDPPSRAADGARARRLRGDLDAIVLTAMRKEPGHRYASVATLADDIRRHRRSLPVSARKGTLIYRARRFVGRHRLGVMAGLLFVVLLAGGGVMAAMQARRAATERDRAEQTATFLASVLGQFGPAEAGGPGIPPRQVLDGSVERVRSELSDRPLLQARLFTELGRIYQYWGLVTPARDLLRDALAIRVRHLGPSDLAVARTRLDLGILGYTMGEPDTDSLFTAAIETFRRRLAPDDPLLLTALSNYAIALRARDQLDAAELLFREVLDGTRDATAATQPLRATTLTYLGKLLTTRGAYGEADRLLDEAVDATRALHGDTHPVVANALEARGEWALAREELDQAGRIFDRVLAMRRSFFDDDHPDVAASMENLALLERARGDLAAAESYARRALSTARDRFGAGSMDVAKRLELVAELRLARGDEAEAAALYREALRIWAETLPPSHSRTDRARRALERIGADATTGAREGVEAR